jgi:hypothetical protein
MDRNSKEFKALQNKWYRKLNKAGFEDIESRNGMLKDYHSKRFAGQDASTFTEKERYYQLASQLVHTYPFPDTTSKTMWRLHAKGESIEYISNALNLKTEVVSKFIRTMELHIKTV